MTKGASGCNSVNFIEKQWVRRSLLARVSIVLALFNFPSLKAQDSLETFRKSYQREPREKFLKTCKEFERDVEKFLSLITDLTSIPSPRDQATYRDLHRISEEPEPFNKEFFDWRLIEEARHTSLVYGIWKGSFNSDVMYKLILGEHSFYKEKELIQRQIYESIWLLRELEKAWDGLLNVIELCISRYALNNLKHPVWIELILMDLSDGSKYRDVNANTYPSSQVTYAREYLRNMIYLRGLVSGVIDRYVYALKQ